jgi:hypothetical protein
MKGDWLRLAMQMPTSTGTARSLLVSGPVHPGPRTDDGGAGDAFPGRREPGERTRDGKLTAMSDCTGISDSRNTTPVSRTSICRFPGSISAVPGRRMRAASVRRKPRTGQWTRRNRRLGRVQRAPEAAGEPLSGARLWRDTPRYPLTEGHQLYAPFEDAGQRHWTTRQRRIGMDF